MRERESMSKTKAMSNAPWMMLAMLAIMIMIPNLAQAADFGFTPECSDKSIKDFLVPLFGSLFERCGGVSGGGFQQAMVILNSAALTVGGMLAAYTLVAGTMQTAHDGEMLGKRWSSMWLPIRTALGVGLVVPVAGGYCVAQLLTGFLIEQGVGVADKAWNVYATSFSSPKDMAPKVVLPNVDDLARSMLKSQVCMAAINDIAKGSPYIISEPLKASDGANERLYGGGGLGDRVCGSVSFTPIYAALSSLNTPNPGTTANWTSFSSSATSPILQAHLSAVRTMEGALAPLAQQLVDATNGKQATPDISAGLVAAEQKYQQSVAGASRVFSDKDALNGLVEAAKQDGWFMAGSWFMKAAQMQDTINRAVSNTPTSYNVDTAVLKDAFGVSINPYFAKLEAANRLSSSSLSASGNGAAGPGNSLSSSGNGGGSGNGLASSINKIGSSDNPLHAGANEFMSILFGSAAQNIFQIDSNRNPMMALKDTGDYLMVGSEAGIALGVGLRATSAAMQEGSKGIGIPIVGAFLNATAGFLGVWTDTIGLALILLSTAFLAFASGLAIYLPMAPFLIYFGVFVGWLILCVEAVVAAPLWAVMHLSPQGDDMMGAARQGYMLIFSLLMRPVLVVFGFIGALIAAPVVINGFNQIFFPVFKLAMVGSMIGLVSSLVMVIIYFGTMTFLFHKMFGLAGEIPDKILRWVGGGGEQMGEVGRGLSQAGQGHGHAKEVATMMGQSVAQTHAAALGRASAKDNADKSRTFGAADSAFQQFEGRADKVAELGSEAATAKMGARQVPTMENLASAARASADHAASLSSAAAAAEQGSAKAEAAAAVAKDPNEKAGYQTKAADLSKQADALKSQAATERGEAEKYLKQMGGQAEQWAAEGVSGSSPEKLQQAESGFKDARDTANAMGMRSLGDSFQQKANDVASKISSLNSGINTTPPLTNQPGNSG